MPKEMVYGEQTVSSIEMRDAVVPLVPIIEVRWHRDGGYVQLVTKATDPSEGRVAGDSPETHVTDGYYVDINRQGINDLIRKLRRARDQAFGRDE